MADVRLLLSFALAADFVPDAAADFVVGFAALLVPADGAGVPDGAAPALPAPARPGFPLERGTSGARVCACGTPELAAGTGMNPGSALSGVISSSRGPLALVRWSGDEFRDSWASTNGVATSSSPASAAPASTPGDIRPVRPLSWEPGSGEAELDGGTGGLPAVAVGAVDKSGSAAGDEMPMPVSARLVVAAASAGPAPDEVADVGGCGAAAAGVGADVAIDVPALCGPAGPPGLAAAEPLPYSAGVAVGSLIACSVLFDVGLQGRCGSQQVAGRQGAHERTGQGYARPWRQGDWDPGPAVDRTVRGGVT
ncbi:hypothetical protein ACH40D_43970 [Streptomyces olivaceoviridis]|uniref:Uncharacterized protein n=1 Tax=Streptomyces olivaceoviridis TaxID=1921 RepID=A0ABW7VN70_STROI|nr:hypothetical protein [Streptomyces corchorusii]